MAELTIRYYAAARAAAGVTEESAAAAARPATLGEAIEQAARRHGPELARVLTRCSYLLDGVAAHGRDTPLADVAEIDVLPPFAGG